MEADDLLCSRNARLKKALVDALADGIASARPTVKTVANPRIFRGVSFLFEVRCDSKLLHTLSGETLKPSCLSEKCAAKPI